MRNFTFLPIILSILFISCDRENFDSELQKYYFPVASMEDPLIYHYYKLSDHRNPEDSYWIMKKRTENDKTFLITQVFERNKEGYLVIVEVRKELIDYSGVHLNSISGNYEDQKENMQWATSQIEQGDLIFMDHVLR